MFILHRVLASAIVVRDTFADVFGIYVLSADELASFLVAFIRGVHPFF